MGGGHSHDFLCFGMTEMKDTFLFRMCTVNILGWSRAGQSSLIERALLGGNQGHYPFGVTSDKKGFSCDDLVLAWSG